MPEEAYNLSDIDLPITLYDRPQLAAANLLRGDVSAFTRSLLAPQTLTPSELKTLRFQVLGKNPNPLLKTIVDIGTNPLVWLGLAMVVGYPIGSAHPIQDISTGSAKAIKEVGPWMSKLSSALGHLRAHPKLWPKVVQLVTTSTKLKSEWAKGLDDIFSGFVKTYRSLTKKDLTQVAMWLDGMGRPARLAEKGGMRGALAFQRIKGVGVDAIVPALEKEMAPEVFGVAKQIKSFLADKVWKEAKNLKEVKAFFVELDARGIKLGNFVDDYLPHIVKYNRFENLGLKAVIGEDGVDWLIENVIDKGVAGSVRRRAGLSIPLEGLRRAKELGIGIRPEVIPALEASIGKRVTNIRGAVDDVMKVILADTEKITTTKAARDRFLKDIQPAFKKLEMKLTTRLGHSRIVTEEIKQVGEKLWIAARQGGGKYEMYLDDVAKALGSPAEYSLDLPKVLDKYINTMGNSVVWWGTVAPGETQALGPGIMDYVNNEIKTGYVQDFFKKEFLPYARGFKSSGAMRRDMAWREWWENVRDWVSTSPTIGKLVPAETQKWLREAISPEKLSGTPFGRSIAEYFYLSTLGFPNLGPPSKNILQVPITTMNIREIGPSGILRAFRDTGDNPGLLNRMRKFANLLTQGVPRGEAFNTSFDDFVKDMGPLRQTLHLAETRGGVPVTQLNRAYQGFRNTILAPFGATETWNQLVSFYSAKQTGLWRGLTQEVAGNYGANVNLLTQFGGGILGRPRILYGLPAPLRQFLQFPLRYLELLVSGTRWGPDPTKLNLGMLGSTIAGSTAMYLGARNLLGADLSQGLLTGALPLPTYEKAPFFPFPFVPPAVGIAGSVAQAAFTGTTEPLGSVAGLAVPGGIGLRRIYRNLAPKFADYRNRTEDGRIPVYDKRDTLIGTFTPLQLSLRALGLPVQSVRSEQAAMEWLLAQRDKIRGFRREYLQALMENSYDKAERIDKEFQKAYPELGKLELRKQDIRTVRNRREVSRIGRVLTGFPRAYQPLFQGAMGAAGLSSMMANLPPSTLALEEMLQ